MATTILLALMGAVAALAVYRKLWQSEETTDERRNPLEFSLEFYRPMQWVLSRQDWEYLVQQPGYSAALGRKVRRQRRRVFRSYLRQLRQDFSALDRAARSLLVDSAEDRPELARALGRHRMLFLYWNIRIEAMLALQWAGVGAVNVQPMLDTCETLRAALWQSLAPEPEWSAV